MNVRWMAVITGYLVDFFISALLSVFVSETFFTSPNLTRASDLILMGLLVLSSGVGGYVAGRIAQADRWLHGLLVGVVGVLIGQIGPPLPRVFVLASVVACLLASLGGYLSRYPALPQQRSSG